MAKNILILAEHSNGKIKKATFELAGVASRLAQESGGTVHALVIGSGITSATNELAHYGVQNVHVADAECCEPYNAQIWTSLLVKTIQSTQAQIVLGTASPIGKDTLPRAGARLGCDVVSDCTGIHNTDNGLIVRRPYYAGKVFADVGWKDSSSTQLATLRPNSFPLPAADTSATTNIEQIPVDLDPSTLTYQTKEVIQAESDRPDLTEASIIVSGGRAMKNEENFTILWSLADAIGTDCTVGASRAAVDSGYVPHAMQVGQTGKTVSPKLYIACGISGAVQHLAGMRTSKVIVAINKDKDAPIFTKADYGIVGDLFEVVPLLTEEIKLMLAE